MNETEIWKRGSKQKQEQGGSKGEKVRVTTWLTHGWPKLGLAGVHRCFISGAVGLPHSVLLFDPLELMQRKVRTFTPAILRTSLCTSENFPGL